MESDLRYPLGDISTELCWAVEVLHEMWKQAENIQGET